MPNDDDRVDVWQFSLEASDAVLSNCRAVLSQAEGARAARFRTLTDRNEYTVAHGLLREVLSGYCAISPAELEFAAETGGKPVLRSADNPPVTFNLAHSAGRMLVAVARDRAVGVDIERSDRRSDPLKLARRYFFGTEAEDIEAGAEDLRRTRFFEYWVAKEATVKAAGLGLRYPLDALRIHFSADRSVARVESLQPDRLASDWTVRMLPNDSGWPSAVASRGDRWTLRFLREPGSTQVSGS